MNARHSCLNFTSISLAISLCLGLKNIRWMTLKKLTRITLVFSLKLTLKMTFATFLVCNEKLYGVFLINIKIYCKDGDIDNHMVEYNASLGRMTDNNRDADGVFIEDKDRVSSSSAYKVFYYFVPHSKYMEISDVYQLFRM